MADVGINGRATRNYNYIKLAGGSRSSAWEKRVATQIVRGRAANTPIQSTGIPGVQAGGTVVNNTLPGTSSSVAAPTFNFGNQITMAQVGSYITKNVNLASVIQTGNSAGTNVIDMNGQKITNLGVATNPFDAVNLAQTIELIRELGPSPGLERVLEISNNVGSNSIDMNNQSLLNTYEIKTSSIDEKTDGDGIGFFTGPGSESAKIIYYFSAVIENSIAPTVVKSITLSSSSLYTILCVTGYYCTDGPDQNKSGNFFYIEKASTGALPGTSNMLTSIFPGLPEVTLSLVLSGTTLDIVFTGSLNNTISLNGTVDLWRHY